MASSRHCVPVTGSKIKPGLDKLAFAISADNAAATVTIAKQPGQRVILQEVIGMYSGDPGTPDCSFKHVTSLKQNIAFANDDKFALIQAPVCGENEAYEVSLPAGGAGKFSCLVVKYRYG